MAVKDMNRIFVGGLAYETSDRTLEMAFGRFGDIIEAQVIKDRDTGRPRGFGFVTYSDPLAVDTAISEMNNVELDGRIISVNRAEVRDGGTRNGGYRDRDRDDSPRGPRAIRDRDECYKCGRSGHWARDCPTMNGGGGGGGRSSRYSPSPPPRYSGGRGGRRGGGRGGGPDRYAPNYFVDDRYDGGRYVERERIDPRDRYMPERYAPPPAEHYPIDRYGGDQYPIDRYPPNGYAKERGYEKERVYEREPPIRGGHGGGYYRDRDPPRGYERDVQPPRMGGGGSGRYENGSGYRGRPGPVEAGVGGILMIGTSEHEIVFGWRI